jgi:replicative DNA helicase
MDKPDKSQQPAIEIPHDIVNEQVLIAAVLVDEDARRELLPKVPAELFVEAAHRSIWSAMRLMRERGLEWSEPTLHQICSRDVELGYLERLRESYPGAPASLQHHVATLRWDAVRVEAVQGPVADLLRALRDPLTPAERVRSIGRQVAAAFDQNVDRRFMLDPVELAREHVEQMRHRACWPYGLDGLDRFEDGSYRMIPGSAPGKITAITAVSGAAKSVVAAAIALEQARRRRRVLYGAWEMGPGPTLELLTCMSLGWSRYIVSTGGLSEEDLAVFRERAEQIGTYIRFFDAPFSKAVTRRYDNDAAVDELHRCIADSGAELAVLDLLERMFPDGRPEHERRSLFRVQQVAQQTACHLLLVCQQKLKEIEDRSDKRPTRSTILGSQAWVDISDTILGLHRPGQWRPVGDDVLLMLILKQRFGRWPLAVEFDWDGDRCILTRGRSVEYEAVGRGSSFADDFLGANDKKRR